MPANVKSGERIAPEEKPVRARDLGLIVEGAILNALTAARDMRGRDGNFVPALPHDQVREILKQYRR